MSPLATPPTTAPQTRAACRRRHQDRPADTQAGFTLVELLVVLAIIALIASLTAPQILRYLGSARVDTAKAQIQRVSSALELYYLDNGTYPTAEQGLAALAVAPGEAPGWNGPYLKGADVLADPWGAAYAYEWSADGSGFVVRSLGRDGKPGGEGADADLAN